MAILTSSVKKSTFVEPRKIIFSGLAIFLTLALVSHSPKDPSWSTWTSLHEIQNWVGRSGSVLSDVLLQLLGAASFVLIFFLVAEGFLKNEKRERKIKISSWLLFLFSCCLLIQKVFPTSWIYWHSASAGGVVGEITDQVLLYITGKVGTWLITSLLFISAVASILKNVREEFFKAFFAKLLPAKAKAPANPSQSLDTGWKPYIAPKSTDSDLARLSEQSTKRIKTPPPKKAISSNGEYEMPSVEILSGKADAKLKPVDKNWYLEKAEILVQKLKDFGVEGEVVHISPGPVITVYEFKPASGVKIKEIANLSDDLTLALSVLSVRIVAPIPGKPVIGIEIPSPHRETVFFKDLVQETDFYGQGIKIPVVLGRLASGEPVVTDLASMPHLLIAGSTGTGKSVFINTLISSLLFRHSPEQLKLILVDPKMVELSCYEGIPHLLLPVVVDSKKAALALRWAVDEMERRYSLMHTWSARNLDAYNDKRSTMSTEEQEENPFLPYIVVVIDEYADLMAVVPKDVELSIARLAQKARAAGIHLVLATQRPSTDVVTGTIKANFPSRISFRVASSVDSKTILDRTGADRLLGHGDLLFHSAGFTSLKRMQGAFLSDGELLRVVEHLKSQGEPVYDERILQPREEDKEGGNSAPTFENEEDANLYDSAVKLVTDKGEASISLIQRHLRIGYNRAASLMEQLEKEGVVAPASGPTKRRSVIANSV